MQRVGQFKTNLILRLEVVWAGHAQRMTIPCKNVFITALADFSGYLWRKIPQQKI